MPISLQGATLCDDSRATAADHVSNQQERIVTLRAPFVQRMQRQRGRGSLAQEAENGLKMFGLQTLSKKLEASAASAPALDP